MRRRRRHEQNATSSGSLGRTPIAPVKLSPGSHQIEIRDRASGRVDTRAVVVRSGQRQVIRVKF